MIKLLTPSEMANYLRLSNKHFAYELISGEYSDMPTVSKQGVLLFDRDLVIKYLEWKFNSDQKPT